MRRKVGDQLRFGASARKLGGPFGPARHRADEKYGEEVCAWIIRRPDAALDEDGVRGFCRGQIAHYKIPRYIRFVECFPMTVTGKVQKFEMRKAMESGQELG